MMTLPRGASASAWASAAACGDLGGDLGARRLRRGLRLVHHGLADGAGDAARALDGGGDAGQVARGDDLAHAAAQGQREGVAVDRRARSRITPRSGRCTRAHWASSAAASPGRTGRSRRRTRWRRRADVLARGRPGRAKAAEPCSIACRTPRCAASGSRIGGHGSWPRKSSGKTSPSPTPGSSCDLGVVGQEREVELGGAVGLDQLLGLAPGSRRWSGSSRATSSVDLLAVLALRSSAT